MLKFLTSYVNAQDFTPQCKLLLKFKHNYL